MQLTDHQWLNVQCLNMKAILINQVTPNDPLHQALQVIFSKH